LKGSLLFLVLFVIFSPLAWSFSYPNSAATPEQEKRVNENLHRTYNGELKEIRKGLKGDPDSLPNLRLLSSKINIRNKKFLEELPQETSQPVSGDLAQKVLDTVATHPIVGDAVVQKYDREGLNVGFCFGKAAYIHVELLRRGVNPKSLGKVFAIGKFRSGKAVWDFHVTPVVLGPKNEWWAMDTVTSEKVSPIAIWMRNVEKLDMDPAHPLIRFYFSDAVKFQPLYGAYGPENLYFPYFNNYFVDLAKWFDEHPVHAL